MAVQPPSKDLPVDLITTEILPRLPAKSLLRFKSVCKLFNTIISSPEFVHLHLHHSLSSNNHLLIFPAITRSFYIFDLESVSSSATVLFSWPKSTGDISVVGSCNGLLLIYAAVGFHRLVILNPSTRTSVEVPCSDENPGFGFDHNSDDYKIVGVSAKYGFRSTWLYSLNSKSYRMVESGSTSDSLEVQYSGVLIKNHLLHWKFWSPSKRKRRIGCFDVCLEEWIDDVLLPDYYYDPSQRNYFLDFGVVDGTMYSSFENRDNMSYEIWMLKEYGVQESWTKLLSVAISDELSGGVVLLACGKAGSNQVLLRQRHKSKLFWYNMVDGVISTLKGPKMKDYQYQPYICKGSLVNLPEAKFVGAVYEPFCYEQLESAWNLYCAAKQNKVYISFTVAEDCLFLLGSNRSLSRTSLLTPSIIVVVRLRAVRAVAHCGFVGGRSCDDMKAFVGIKFEKVIYIQFTLLLQCAYEVVLVRKHLKHCLDGSI